VVATSHAVRESLGCAGQAEVVPNAVDLNQFRLELKHARQAIRAELGVPDSARLIAVLGSVQRVKGHWVALDAIARIRAAVPEVRLLVVAGGPPPGYERTCKGRIKRVLGLPTDGLDALRRDARLRGLEHALVITGFRTDVPRLLAASDAVVFPSLRAEGFGRPLIEGMAMGLPVIGSDIGPTREITGDTGLLVPPGDAAALGVALTRALKDSLLAERLGREGRERVERWYALPRLVERFAQLYQRVGTSRPIERMVSG
jgi:glycosyltransferase involved in cell wall biosynthesis